MAVKKKKKMVDLIDIYLSQFIARISPKEFEKILNHNHEILEPRISHGFMILSFKKNVDVDFKLYDFYKSKDGMKIDCIEKYYYRDDLDEDFVPKNCSNKCFLCKQKLLNLPREQEIPILECIWCHRTALSLFQQSILKLKSQRRNKK